MAKTEGIMNEAKKNQLYALARRGRKVPASGKKGVVTTGHPLTSQVAIDVLAEGGNAVDAIIAAAVAGNVVEPLQSSLYSLLTMQYYEAKTGEVSFLNASFNVPLNLPSTMTPEQWSANAGIYMRDGRSVSVSGFWAGVEEALRVHGTMPKKRLFAPAIDFARNGVESNTYLTGSIAQLSRDLGISEQAREIFMPKGTFFETGEKFYQKRVADLLERLVEEGNDYYYHGGFAERVCKAVQEAGGWLSMEDFARYEARWDTPVRTTYRDYDFYAPPAPYYGGQSLAEIFNVLEQLDLRKMGPAAQSGETLWRMKQIIRLVDWENVNWHRNGNKPSLEYVLSKKLAVQRLASLPEKGFPKGKAYGLGSSHLTVADAEGNVATLFNTSYGPVTNGIYVDGVQIPPSANLYMHGIPKRGERAYARAGLGMFLKNNKPVLVAGSPSMSTIDTMVQSCVSVLDFGMTVEETVHQPRFGGDLLTTIPGAFKVEADMPKEIFDFLKDKEVPFEKINPWNADFGCFEAIVFDTDGAAHACADPRRVGQAFAV